MIEKGNNFVSSDFLRVLKALKENILIEINVADICQVTAINGVEEYIWKSITDESMITALTLEGETINVGDLVVVIFINGDFRTNLKRLKAGLVSQAIESNQRHSKAFGVIIKVIPL